MVLRTISISSYHRPFSRFSDPPYHLYLVVKSCLFYKIDMLQKQDEKKLILYIKKNLLTDKVSTVLSAVWPYCLWITAFLYKIQKNIKLGVLKWVLTSRVAKCPFNAFTIHIVWQRDNLKFTSPGVMDFLLSINPSPLPWSRKILVKKNSSNFPQQIYEIQIACCYFHLLILRSRL